jgi:hypothetical protein
MQIGISVEQKFDDAFVLQQVDADHVWNTQYGLNHKLSSLILHLVLIPLISGWMSAISSKVRKRSIRTTPNNNRKPTVRQGHQRARGVHVDQWIAVCRLDLECGYACIEVGCTGIRNARSWSETMVL